MSIFERLTAGWVNDDVVLFLFLKQVFERGDITRLGAGLTTVAGRRTGTRPQVIARLQNWVVMVGFDDGRAWCWGLPPCTSCGSDWGGRHRVGWGACRVYLLRVQLSPSKEVQLGEVWTPSEKVQDNQVGMQY